MGEDPLPVRPGVVVLGVDLEGVGDEREFGHGVVGLLDQESTMMPDLICFQVRDRELVHQSQLGVQRGVQGNEGFVPILPDRRRSVRVRDEYLQRGVEYLPCRVVCRVLTDDVLCEIEHPGALLPGLDDASEVICDVFV